MDRREFIVSAGMSFRLETYLKPREVEAQVRELLESLALGGTIQVKAEKVE